MIAYIHGLSNSFSTFFVVDIWSESVIVISMKMIGHRGETFFQGPLIWSGKIHPLDERFMAKNDSSNTFGDFSNKIKLTPDRMNLKPVNSKLSFEQYLMIAIKEGHALLDEEAKNAPKDSVTKPTTPDSVKLENKLGEVSKNPYVRARIEILNKLSPEARTVIEKMEKNEIERDLRYERFCKAIQIKGDQLSGNK